MKHQETVTAKDQVLKIAKAFEENSKWHQPKQKHHYKHINADTYRINELWATTFDHRTKRK